MGNLNKYSIKWAVIAPFSSKFNRNYESALHKAGFSLLGDTGLWGDHFNSNSPESVARIKKQISTLRSKIASYKRKKAIFSFIITDMQFGLIGGTKSQILANKPGWVGLPITNGMIAITYNQMYAHGAIQLPCSQADGEFGKTFNGIDFKRSW